MPGLQKRQLAILIAVGTSLAPVAVAAQGVAAPPVEAEEPQNDAAKLDALFVELAEPGRDDWERIENEIIRIWSKSGSPSMDLLLRRGNEALEAEDYEAALEHFSALTDHAPEFAEGWNGRATTFYLMDEYALAVADVERVLALEPRHFGALSGLAFMLEAMDQPELALEALHMVQALNPNRPNINQAVARLEQMNGEADL
jgi:tetratricopeptide (TPR) repeat protein